MLFQLVLTKFFKVELLSCLPKVDHVIKSCKEPIGQPCISGPGYSSRTVISISSAPKYARKYLILGEEFSLQKSFTLLKALRQN